MPLALSACSAFPLALTNPSMHVSPTPGSIRSAPVTVLRVIVKFRQKVPYSDAAFLQNIAQQIQTPIAYISSVSVDTHVYQLVPQPGQNHADILRRLSAIPSVLSVESDALVHHHSSFANHQRNA